MDWVAKSSTKSNVAWFETANRELHDGLLGLRSRVFAARTGRWRIGKLKGCLRSSEFLIIKGLFWIVLGKLEEPRLLGVSRPLRNGPKNRNAAEATSHRSGGCLPAGYVRLRLVPISRLLVLPRTQRLYSAMWCFRKLLITGSPRIPVRSLSVKAVWRGTPDAQNFSQTWLKREKRINRMYT